MPRTGKRKATPEKYFTPTDSGTRAQIRIGGYLHRKHFPFGTPVVVMREWLLKIELKHRGTRATRSGWFADDARAYLRAVAAMPTIQQRTRHIEDWIAAFHDRRRDEITPDEIRAQLQVWRATEAGATVNKRRTALMHLFSVLDGKAERNPVRDAPRFAEPAPAPNTLTAPEVRTIFAAMAPSKSKARLMVIAYTGIPPAQIAQLTAADVNVKGRVVAVPGRHKGKGTRGRMMPLTSKGAAAFRLFIKEDAWGAFGRSPLRRLFQRYALAAIKREDVTPYDLRHFFGTEIYRRSGDIRATQILMDHSTERLTHRYTVAAQDPRVTAAVKAWR